jgi:hypothetical protein
MPTGGWTGWRRWDEFALTWIVEFHHLFTKEFAEWPLEVRRELLARSELLVEYGPGLKRPHADTMKGSKHGNMKELRFEASDGVWRVAFAFDPKRRAILLVGGDKSGTAQRRFYRALIKRADARFDDHLARLKPE